MTRLLRTVWLGVLIAGFVLVAAPTPAQTEPAPQEPAEPTEGGEATEVEAEPEPSADLSAANEAVMDGDYDTAIELLTALGQEFPDDTRVMLLHAEILLQRRKADEAVPLLEKCLEIDPEMLRANFQLGAAKVALKDSEGALAAFAREIELNEDKQVLMLAHLNRSMLFGQVKNWEGVIAELESVLVIDPGNVQVYGDLASTYLRAGDADKAQAALERGVEAGFRSAIHYYSLGARRYKDKQNEQAVDAFLKALEIDPNLARAERSLGAALEQLDRTEEALVHLRRYLELAPNAPDASQIAEKIKQAEKG